MSAPDHGAERDTLADHFIRRVADCLEDHLEEYGFDPYRYPSGENKSVLLLNGTLHVFPAAGGQFRLTLAADQPTAPVPGPTRAAEGLRARIEALVDQWDEQVEWIGGDGRDDVQNSCTRDLRAALEATEGEGYDDEARQADTPSGSASYLPHSGEGEAGAAGLTDEADDPDYWIGCQRPRPHTFHSFRDGAGRGRGCGIGRFDLRPGKWQEARDAEERRSGGAR